MKRYYGFKVKKAVFAGREKAIAVFNRHKVLTDAFVKMGMSVAVAEDNACKVKHVISEEAFETIKSYFSEKNMNKVEIFSQPLICG